MHQRACRWVPPRLSSLQVTKAMDVSVYRTRLGLPWLRFKDRREERWRRPASQQHAASSAALAVPAPPPALLPLLLRPTVGSRAPERYCAHRTALVYRTLCCRKSYLSSQTDQYDAQAMRYLSYALYPLVLGYAAYALISQKPRSW